MKLNELLASIERDVPITLIVDEQYFRVGKKGDLVRDLNYFNNRIHYMSLLLSYTRYDQIKFDLVRNKILDQFPELLMPENCLEKIPDYGKMEDYIASIEVAYPATWTVEYEMIDS